MSDAATKRNGILDISCPACGAPAEYDIIAQNYRCRYCGQETGVGETLARKREYRSLIRDRLARSGPPFRMETARCTGCGAEITFAENEALTDCAFCGRKLVRKAYAGPAVLPELLIPFRITREEAKRRLLDWCEANSRRPEAKTLRKNADRLEGFYLPYLLIKGPTACTVRRRNTDRVFHCRGFIDGTFVNVSSNLNNAVLDGTEPYNVADLREFEFSFLAGQRVKTADLRKKDAEARIKDEIAAGYEPFISKTLESRAVTVAPTVDGLMAMDAVLPAYYLRVGEVTAAVNGQTGKVAVQEAKDRFTMPWILRPVAALAVLIALTFLAAILLSPGQRTGLLIAGALSFFYLIVVLTAYHDHYGRSGRFLLRRRILSSDNQRPPQEQPVFFESLGGETRPVRIRFTTPARVLRMVLAALLVTFLPLVIAFVLNGFSAEGLHLSGAAVWLCVFVPVTPIWLLKFGRLRLHEKPLLYTPDRKGVLRRYRKRTDAEKKRGFAFNARDVFKAILVAAVCLLILFVNVRLVMERDEDAGNPAGETAAETREDAAPDRAPGEERI